MARLRVQHCVVNQTTRQYGPDPTSDLLGVDYFYTVPPDTEFPRSVAKLELFVRFVATGRLGGRVRVTVTRLAPDGSDRERVYHKFFALPAVAQPGVLIHDRGLKLVDLLLPW